MALNDELFTAAYTGNPRKSGICTNLTQKRLRYTLLTDVLYRASVVIKRTGEIPDTQVTVPESGAQALKLREPSVSAMRFTNDRERKRPPTRRPFSCA